MGATVTFDGLDILRAMLRETPERLVGRANAIVDRRAQNAYQAIRSAYQAHRVTGYLADHVTIAVNRQSFGVMATVRSNAPHAHWNEYGTQLRHNKSGANRGAMPPNPTVVPIAIRERRAMYGELLEMVKEDGFEVSGTLG